MNWEGGVREPFIARWPGKIPPGRTCDAVVSMMDIFPTVGRLCHAGSAKKPLDGIDLWPVLSGAKSELDRAPLLYFNNVQLECARWKNWKLHISRENIVKWSPAPPGGVVQLMLPEPELYDLSKDVDESYDVAPEHPDLVKHLFAQMESALKTFPPQIQQAYAQTKARKTDPSLAGQVPHEAKQ
jgi:arylsulfatase A-like enzyme